MKNKIAKLIQSKETKKAELAAKAEKTQDVNELKNIKEQIAALNDDIASLKAVAETTDAPADPSAGGEGGEARSQLESRQIATPSGNLNPLGTYTLNSQNPNSEAADDIFSTMEYRSAFKDYVLKGTPIPSKFKEQMQEQRAAEISLVADVGAVIPTTVMQKVIEEALSSGMILPRVTQTAFQGGVEIPTSDIRPVATWIKEETVSDTQKKEIKDKITFTYHMLECRVALGLLTATVTLPIFESTIIKNIKEAMIIAIEASIVKGSGSGQPKGILNETIDSGRIVTMDETEVGTVKGWAKAESAVPLAYEAGALYIMAKSTWESYLNGAVDTTGQRLGFVSISGNQQRKLNGRDVLLTDYIPGFDKADSGDIFAVMVKLSDYMLNSNMNMSYKKYFNEDTNKWVHKSIMIVDGKMVDTYGMVYIKKY